MYVCYQHDCIEKIIFGILNLHLRPMEMLLENFCKDQTYFICDGTQKEIEMYYDLWETFY